MEMARGSNEYDMNEDFMNAMAQAINNYLGAESSARAGEAGAISQAEGNVYGNPLNAPVPCTEATLDPDWQKKYGTPVYTGPDGKLYTIGPDGNPVAYTPPAVPPPVAPPPTEPTLDWGTATPTLPTTEITRSETDVPWWMKKSPIPGE
jgi:hypothetical protein